MRGWSEMSTQSIAVSSGAAVLSPPAAKPTAGAVSPRTAAQPVTCPGRRSRSALSGDGEAAGTPLSPAGRRAEGEGLASCQCEAASPERRRYVHNPWVDFLTLGGGSLIVLGALAAFYPRDDTARGVLASVAVVLAFLLTYPHVAHSYQLFYKGFRRKAFAPESALAARYRFAGIVLPAGMAAFFAFALARDSIALLGLLGNVTLLMSGWHYTKQGFGILMLDAARKGIRFSAGERRRLLWNTHLVWVTFWLMINDTLVKRELFGITYYLIDVPESLRTAMLGVVLLSASVIGYDFFRKWRAERALPVNGVVAYAATVYAWVLIGRFDPVLLLVVPLFHGLQYLSVVWRYRINVEEARLRARSRRRRGAGGRGARAGLARFAVLGGLLGAAGFWGAPAIIDTLVDYDRAIFGAALLFFIGWTFFGIHHAVMDNVIWRRENPEARRYLFEA